MKQLIFIFLLLVSSFSFSGVTIHFSGKLPENSKKESVLNEAAKYAKAYDWKFIKEADSIIIFPHEWCEPIELRFQGNALKENFVKTQFSGKETHVKVIGLFKKIEKKFSSLEIIDEGEYWETGDENILRARIEEVEGMMAQIKSQHPHVKGPRKIGSGKIVDLISE